MKNIRYILFLVGISACMPSSRISVTNVQDMASFAENGFIYSLPRTRLSVSVTAVQHKMIPGPYGKFADQFLGIAKVPRRSRTYWEIIDMGLNKITEPDPDHFYFIQNGRSDKAMENLLEMTDRGLILKANDSNPFVRFYPDRKGADESVQYTDMWISKGIISGLTVKGEEVMEVKVPTDLPVTKPKKELKTLAQKASEAADFIIKMRKRRFKLLSGQYTVFPEGQALETAVRELNALEEEYLSLFIGKTYTDTVKRTFYYVPRSGEEPERNVICRFSEEIGLFDAASASGKPVLIEMESAKITESLDHLHSPFTGTVNENVVFYRIPDKATVKITYSNRVFLEAELSVCQYGSIVPHSVKER